MRFDQLDRTFIVAEVGVNHEGDERVARDLIEQAAVCGADAVKFQTYEAASYVSSEQPERLARVKRFEISREGFRRLADVAQECGLIFFSTPLGLRDVDFLDEIAPIFKVASGEITYLDLIRRIASKGKPMIISTGLAIEEEIEAAVKAVLEIRPSAREDGSLMLMHCKASYPVAPGDADLRNIIWLKDRFGLPIGYSDHTLGIKACELAVALGAVALEKHFTYRTENQEFRDHALSADPKDLKALVDAVRTAETYLGSGARKRSVAEIEGEAYMRRSLAAAVAIKQGTPVKADWLTALRPAWGMGPNDGPQIVGRTLNRDVAPGEIIRASFLND